MRVLQTLDDHLQSLYEKKKLPGISVSIWDASGDIFSKGYGYRNKAGDLPVDKDTIYGIASMSKSQTALACALLACEGKLSFEDPVYQFFPHFSVPGTARDAVQLRHLAMHRSGIPPMEPLEWSIAMHSRRTNSELVRTLQAGAPCAFDTIDEIIAYISACPYSTLGAPGEYMSYCNEGYALLSYVVDQAAGMPLETFLQERVYVPLGMTRTVLDVDAAKARALAGGNMTSLFTREKEDLVCDDEWSVLPPYRGCGLVKSTARDMAVYYRCLSSRGRHEGKQVLPSEAIEMMVGCAFPLSATPFYAFGLNKRLFDGHTICEHSGGLHGVASHGGFLLDEGWGFAALCNQGDVDVDDFVWAMYNWVLDLPLERTHRWYAPAGRSFSDPDMLTGVFRSHEGVASDIAVTLKAGQLFAAKNDHKMPLTYCGDVLFAVYEEDGGVPLRIQALIRDGKAWALRCGTRIYQRVPV